MKMIAIDLGKQQEPDADPKVIQQINFTGNSDESGHTTMSFIIEEANENTSGFSQGTARVL